MNQFLQFKPSDIETTIVGSRKQYSNQLPIRYHKSEILYAIDKYSCLVVVAETGSGKTTCQIPQYLVEAGYSPQPQRVLVSLPRRMAAISIAQRVSEEYQSKLGEQVGYRVRFDSKVSEKTKIEFVTDGLLVRLIMADPLLQLYTVIMVDDVHERTINTDLILALLKKIRRKRPDLKIIVSSATVQAEEVSQFFNDNYKGQDFKSTILQIQGRTFPVDVHYLKQPCKNYLVTSAEICAKIHQEKKSDGDILVFLTCVEEINAFLTILNDIFADKQAKLKMLLLPLYSNLSIEKQLEVFKPTPPGSRKIIASTNIAESSVTIDGVVFVIDTCFQKVKVFDHRKNFESMRIVPLSKQQADQRAGRAGRTKAGQCFRLCTKVEFDNFQYQFPPEILRSKLNDLILQMYSFSLQPSQLIDPLSFLSPVPIENLAQPLTALMAQQQLTLVNGVTKLTELGEIVVDYPLDISMAICVEKAYSEDFQCAEEILKIAAILSVQGQVFSGDAQPLTVLKGKKALGCKEGDQLSLCNILTRYQTIGNKGGWCEQYKVSKSRMEQADRIYKQLLKRSNGRKLSSSVDDVEAVIRCMLTGFFMQVAQRETSGIEGAYRNVYTKEVMYLHSSSVLTLNYPEWIIYNELVEQCINVIFKFSQAGRLVMRECTEIDPHWLLEVAPNFYQDVRKDQIKQKHEQEKQQLDYFDEQKQIQLSEKLLNDEKEKVVFGTFKGKQKPIKQTQGEGGFLKPNLPIKNKEDRVGSLRKSNMLSFMDEDL